MNFQALSITYKSSTIHTQITKDANGCVELTSNSTIQKFVNIYQEFGEKLRPHSFFAQLH